MLPGKKEGRVGRLFLMVSIATEILFTVIFFSLLYFSKAIADLHFIRKCCWQVPDVDRTGALRGLGRGLSLCGVGWPRVGTAWLRHQGLQDARFQLLKQPAFPSVPPSCVPC